MRRFCLVACLISLLLSLLCCGGNSEYDPYVKFMVNHFVEDGVDGNGSPVYKNVRFTYEVLKGHTLEDGMPKRIHDDLALDGYAIISYFTVPEKFGEFKAYKHYVNPGKMPDQSLMERQIRNLDNLVFFQDTEVYAYYAQSAKSNQVFRVKCLNFENVEYGQRPVTDTIEVVIERGEEMSVDLLKRKIRQRGGSKSSLDGGKIMFATYAGEVYEIPDGMTDNWYTLKWAMEAEKGEPLLNLEESTGVREVCIGYEWVKPRSSLNIKVRGLNMDESTRSCNSVQKWEVPVDYAVFEDETALSSFTRCLKDNIYPQDDKAELNMPYKSGSQTERLQMAVTVSGVESYFTKMQSNPNLLFVKNNMEIGFKYESIGKFEGNGPFNCYKAPNTTLVNTILFKPDSDLAGQPLKHVFKNGSIDVSVLQPWMEFSARDGVANTVEIYMMYQLVN